MMDPATGSELGLAIRRSWESSAYSHIGSLQMSSALAHAGHQAGSEPCGRQGCHLQVSSKFIYSELYCGMLLYDVDSILNVVSHGKRLQDDIFPARSAFVLPSSAWVSE